LAAAKDQVMAGLSQRAAPSAKLVKPTWISVPVDGLEETVKPRPV
jgi:hypothetical protein